MQILQNMLSRLSCEVKPFLFCNSQSQPITLDECGGARATRGDGDAGDELGSGTTVLDVANTKCPVINLVEYDVEKPTQQEEAKKRLKKRKYLHCLPDLEDEEDEREHGEIDESEGSEDDLELDDNQFRRRLAFADGRSVKREGMRRRY